MRIIAGSNKGARIFAPNGHGTRPTADRAREAAFSLIGAVNLIQRAAGGTEN